MDQVILPLWGCTVKRERNGCQNKRIFGSIFRWEKAALRYGPVKTLAKEIGALGARQWQLAVEDLLRSGSSSTEIFMGLRWQLDELLKSQLPIPDELRRRAGEMLTTLRKALNDPPALRRG